jgi:iron complex transport system substrate-binding protein
MRGTLNVRKYLITILLLVLAVLGAMPAAAQDGTFPVTVEHKFGSTTITEAPQRVVAIGFTDQDPLLALGVKPIAVRYWYGDEADAIFPWADDEADAIEGDAPIVLNMDFGSLNYEAILELQPDLITAVYSGITQDEYETLSAIAPTIAQSADYIDFGMPWQETTRLIGAALGKAEEADALVLEVESLVNDARTENPAFVGKTTAVAYAFDGSYGFYTAQDPRGRFFSDLGFIIPQELVEIAGESYYATLSAERLELLNQNVLVFVGMQFAENGRDGIESDPLVSQLDVIKEGRAVFVPVELDDALQFNTILSVPYLVEGILPVLQEALGQTAASVSCEAGQRAFEHAMGTSCIPETAERIVVLDTGELDNALALGAPVVGAPVNDALQYQAYLNEQLVGITDIGTISEPNLEAILALAPDLIVGSKQRYEAIYPQLSAIAPTVFTESLRVPWQDNLTFHADAMGKAAEGGQLIADYDAHVAELQAALGDALDTTTVSIVRFRPGQVRLYLKSSYIGYILQDIGLTRPASQDQDVFSAEISLEQVGDVDADYIFITGYDVDDSERATFLESPLWQTLEAVQNGHAIDVNDDTWIAGLGVQAANLVLDDLETLLTQE